MNYHTDWTMVDLCSLLNSLAKTGFHTLDVRRLTAQSVIAYVQHVLLALHTIPQMWTKATFRRWEYAITVDVEARKSWCGRNHIGRPFFCYFGEHVTEKLSWWTRTDFVTTDRWWVQIVNFGGGFLLTRQRAETNNNGNHLRCKVHGCSLHTFF